jgi:hypothetical protein
VCAASERAHITAAESAMRCLMGDSLRIMLSVSLEINTANGSAEKVEIPRMTGGNLFAARYAT